jgi:alanine racemase
MTGKQFTFEELSFFEAVELTGDLSLSFQRLSIDSRLISYPKESCFIAISGENHNGHDYLLDAYNSGVRCFIVEEQQNLETYRDAAFAVVPNTVVALQALAAQHRSQFHIPVVGITGSNGKTIVKEWLHQLLSPDLKVMRSPRSFNSQVGVPLSVWGLREDDQLALIEAGVSLPGEMNLLEKVIQPTFGIFTHLGNAHLENFKDRKALALEKCLLFHRCEKVFYNADQIEITNALDETNFTGERCTWSALSATHTLFVEGYFDNQIQFTWGKKRISVTVNDTSKAAFENTVLCMLVSLELGISEADLIDRIKNLNAVEMRMQHLEGFNGSRIISDVYNNDVNALEIALDDLSKLNTPKKILILSDILQTGVEDIILYERVNQLISSYDLSLLITIGPRSFSHKHLFTGSSAHFDSTEETVAQLDQFDFGNAGILVKGASAFKFELIVRELQLKAHDSILEINLTRLERNLNFYRQQLSPEVRVMAMIKAYGYGTGAAEIAELLEFNRVDYLGVAYINEGVELRKEGIQTPIFVLNADQSSFHLLFKHQLEPEIYSLQQLRALIAEIRNHAVPESGFPIHLKVDTGMHRLGFDDSNLMDALTVIKGNPKIKVASMLSHLAASDNPEHTAFSHQQIKLFETFHQWAISVLGYSIDRHICNTAGVMRFPEAHYEMVRVGIGMYGIPSCAEDEGHVLPVGQLRTRVSQVRTIKAGESVGYTRASKADHVRRIATIPIGYADGFPRSLSEGKGEVLIEGKKFPVVGKVCMDMTMIDVTGSEIQEGSPVIVFGDEPRITTLAASAGTIAYEIIAGISRRVARLYFRE